MHYFGIPRHTQSMITIGFWLSISGNSSEKLHCGNVVNMPNWMDAQHTTLQSSEAVLQSQILFEFVTTCWAKPNFLVTSDHDNHASDDNFVRKSPKRPLVHTCVACYFIHNTLRGTLSSRHITSNYAFSHILARSVGDTTGSRNIGYIVLLQCKALVGLVESRLFLIKQNTQHSTFTVCQSHMRCFVVRCLDQAQIMRQNIKWPKKVWSLNSAANAVNEDQIKWSYCVSICC